MNLQPLKIGNLKAKLPIVQGGMGVGVSLSNLAGTVAFNEGFGVISAAQIGFKEKDFRQNVLGANLRALRYHIKEALKKAAGKGMIGVNIMWAANNYEELVKESIDSGAQAIISGAGLPVTLPKLCMDSDIKIIPIVSSDKAASVLLKLWDKKYNKTADAIVIEGPLAGGHLGFKENEIEENIPTFHDEVKKILVTIKSYEEKYNKKIPAIVAGGIYDGKDIADAISLGADAVQLATRFVTTDECDAHINFKKAYIQCKKEDVDIIKSPVGMPGRAIINDFIKKTNENKNKICNCYRCLSHCNPATIPYCITDALINAVEGNIDEGLIFAGSNAYKTDKIIPVKELLQVLLKETSEI